MSNKRNRYAFTMIELIFVVVVMGILAKFGVEFMAKAYESFIFSKINNNLQSKSGSAVEFIAKRLEYRIKNSVIIRNLSTGVVKSINDPDTDNDATVLEWISSDSDGFRGTTAPLWTGIIDLNSSNATRLISPATNLASLNTLIQTLSSNNADINDSAIYFINSYLAVNNPWGYDGNITEAAGGNLVVSHVAMDGVTTPTNINTQNNTIHPIKSGANSNELWPNGGSFNNVEVFEFYKLSWTANAVRLKDYNTTTHTGDLYFYYDFRPWEGETIDDAKEVLLAEDINTFRFRSAGSLIKVQVCAKSKLTNEEYALCKEKTVY